MKLVLAEKPSVAQSMPCISFDTLKGHKKRKRLHNLNILKEGIEVARMGKKEKNEQSFNHFKCITRYYIYTDIQWKGV